MAKKRELMKIKEIRLAETILFWIERATIFLFVFFGGTPRFLYYSLGLFVFTNLYYASLCYERLYVTPKPKEPLNTLFIFDRYACWLVALHFFMGSAVYRYVAVAFFVISNMNLIMNYFGLSWSCNPTVSKDGNFLSMLVQRHKNFDFDFPQKDEKEEEIEKPLAVEESVEEKTKLDEIEEIQETENIEPDQAHHETLVDGDNNNIIMEKEVASNEEEDDGKEEDFEIVSDKKDDDDHGRVNEDNKFEHDSDDIDHGEDEYCHSSEDNEEDDSLEETTKTQENAEIINDNEVKDYHSATPRENIDLVMKEQTQLQDNILKLREEMVDLVAKVVVLEQENAVLNSKLRGESTSTEQLHRLVLEYERKCQRLEEEKTELNGRLSRAKVESDFYRECMHNLGLDKEISNI